MQTFLLFLLVVYVVGFAIFMLSVISEAPKYGAKVGIAHFAVGVFWPLWGIWYLWTLLTDWWRARKS